MWNSTTYAAMAIAGAGLAVACASPAHACFGWGYSGAYSYGWPYANTGVTNYPAYSYRSCGGVYHIPGWGECGGYGRCGWAPLPPVVLAAPVTEMTAAGDDLTPDRPLVIRAIRIRRGRGAIHRE
jgi:hypothetical protein